MGIALKQLSYTYQEGTPFEGAALFDVNIEIPSGSYTALIGILEVENQPSFNY